MKGQIEGTRGPGRTDRTAKYNICIGDVRDVEEDIEGTVVASRFYFLIVVIGGGGGGCGVGVVGVGGVEDRGAWYPHHRRSVNGYIISRI